MNVAVRLICPNTLKECDRQYDVQATINEKTPVCGFDCAERYAGLRGMRVIGAGSKFVASPCRAVCTNYTTGHFGKRAG